MKSLVFLVHQSLQLICPDPVPAYQCQKICSNAFNPCIDDCRGEMNCEVDCNLQLTECLAKCPCSIECKEGCTNCDSPFCQCNNPYENQDFRECQYQVEDNFSKCMRNCGSDPACASNCQRMFEDEFQNCPCQERCPDGCPCEAYECQAYQNTSQLVLSTAYEGQLPVVLDGLGNSREVENFVFETGTGADMACATMHKGYFYIFGGEGDAQRQISRVNGCGVERVGTLAFDFKGEGCGSSQVASNSFPYSRFSSPQSPYTGEEVFLCFGYSTKKCMRSTDVLSGFTEMPETQAQHFDAGIAVGEKYIFVTGGYDVDLDRPHNKTELYSLENESWSRYADSPYPNGVVHHATVKYEYNTFYTFGGLAGDEELTTIARCGYYYDFEWTIMGNMNTGRYRHSVALVFADVEILIIGGCCESKPTEKCSFTSNGIECESQRPSLDGYSYLPILYNTNTPVPYYCY